MKMDYNSFDENESYLSLYCIFMKYSFKSFGKWVIVIYEQREDKWLILFL